MVLFDNNILIYAHRPDSPRHSEYRKWLEKVVSSGEDFSVPSLVRSGFLRVVTLSGAFLRPTPFEEALFFLTDLMERPNHVELVPGPKHWPLFVNLCRQANARGNLVPDAYLAALAMENGAELISSDRDFAKFPGLRWRHPLDGFYKPEGRSGPAAAREPRRRYRPRARAASLVK